MNSVLGINLNINNVQLDQYGNINDDNARIYEDDNPDNFRNDP